MAVLQPPLDGLDQLTVPLDAGEREVARALARLDDDWTVYIQPKVGLDVPQFVALHDRFGVCVVEVAGWEQGTVRHFPDGGIERLHEDGTWRRAAHPRLLADRHRTVIYDQYVALPGDATDPTTVVRAVVVLPDFTDRQAIDLLSDPTLHDAAREVAVYGGDGFHQRLEEVVRGSAELEPCAYSLDRLRSHLITAARPTVPPPAVTLSDNTRLIASNQAGRQVRRVRGSVGSGKTFAVAARAAQLADEGKTVLVLSFNVTLANRLRSLVNDRCAELSANPTLVSCANFHSFCERVVQDAELAGIETSARRGALWTTATFARACQAFERGFEQRYDAVLVDEGQDFALEWWNMLRQHVVVPDGEMLLVADPTQNLYDRTEWSDEQRVVAAGFVDPWIELTGTYRTSPDLVAVASDFARSYLEGEALLAEPAADRADVGCFAGLTTRRWINVARPGDVGREVGREVVRLLTEHRDLSPSDVVFLCEYHHDGEAAAAIIEAAGYPVHHLFSRNPDDPRRKRRYRFWPGAAAVKGSTVHSFKGWETPVVVVGVGMDPRSKRSAYLSMTRAALCDRRGGCYVSVINADRRIAEFETTFHALDVPSHVPADVSPGVSSTITAAG